MGLSRLYSRWGAIFAAICCALAITGCQVFPDTLHQPVYHNPFPQLHKVAILPFFNQSAEPTVDGDAMAMAYYNELQTIQGFEVMPVGVAKRMLDASGFEPRTAQDFQRLARLMNVDAVIIGSVTEYTPYYPPRLGLSVDWYAANPSFHPVPAGYGLPWGTAEEEYIPSTLVKEAEFSLAQEQLKTQTPEIPPEENRTRTDVSPASHEEIAVNELREEEGAKPQAGGKSAVQSPPLSSPGAQGTPGVKGIVTESPDDLPADWPDPRGFIPQAPTSTKPAPRPQSDPIITHTRVYHGHDADFTQRLENYFYFRDDARFGGYEG